MPTFVRSAPNNANTGIGAAAYDVGNQKYNGKIAAFSPNTNKNITAITVTIPGWLISPIFTAISAILSVPTTEYKNATVITNNAEEITLIKIYLIEPLNCAFSPPSTMSKYDDINNTSKNTNKLKISPVVNAPFTPVKINITPG